MKARGNTLSCMLVFCILAFQSLGQTTATSLTWAPYFDDDKVLIELAEAQRADTANGIFNNYLLIRVTNKTASELDVPSTMRISSLMYLSRPQSEKPYRRAMRFRTTKMKIAIVR